MADFDWRSIAGAVAPFAPKLGGLLGSAFGPIGGVVGSIAGRAIAGAFGVEATPEAVGKAIAQDPKAAARLEKLEAEHADALIAQAQVQVEIAKQSGEASIANTAAINETIRSENLAEAKVSWWHWRHLCGYQTLMFGVISGAGMASSMFLGSPNASDMTAIINAITPIFLALCALNGYVAMDNTNRLQTAITGERGSSLLQTAKTALAKKT